MDKLAVRNHGSANYRGLDSDWEPKGGFELTIRQSAQIAEASYISGNPPLPNEWERIEALGEEFLGKEKTTNETTPELSARVFIKQSSRKAIIGFAGVKDIADLFQCVKFVSGDKSPIWKKIDGFVKNALSVLNEKHKIDKENVRVLGYSLGGSIAHLVGDRFGLYCLSIDGLGVKKFITNQENEHLAQTVAIVPNGVNQLGTVWGEIIYVLPEKNRADYKKEIEDYLDRVLVAKKECSKPEDKEKWLETESPANLALFLIEKTVEFHAISNFTRGEPDRESAQSAKALLQRFVEGNTWGNSKDEFKEALTRTLTDFKGDLGFLKEDVQFVCLMGSEIGRKLAFCVGNGTGFVVGKFVGTAGGAVMGGNLGGVKGFFSGVVNSAGRWMPSKKTFAYAAGTGGVAGIIACAVIPGLQPVAMAAWGASILGSTTAAGLATAGTAITTGALAAGVPAVAATAAGVAVTGAGAAMAATGVVAAAGVVGEGIVNAVTEGANGFVEGAETGGETGGELGERVTNVTLTPLLALASQAAATAVSLPFSLHRIGTHLFVNGVDVVRGSSFVAFFLLFFHLQPKISEAIKEPFFNKT